MLFFDISESQLEGRETLARLEADVDAIVVPQMLSVGQLAHALGVSASDEGDVLVVVGHLLPLLLAGEGEVAIDVSVTRLTSERGFNRQQLMIGRSDARRSATDSVGLNRKRTAEGPVSEGQWRS